MGAMRASDVCEDLKALLVSARDAHNPEFSRSVIDSREAGPRDLFFAIHGERHDGHAFIGDAVRAGAAGVIVDRPVQIADGPAVFHVVDTLSALQRLAARWRSRHALKVIGITGSVGKTTTKEVVAAVLSRRHTTLKTEANLNTEIGVPLTLLKLAPEHQRAVLELGMYVPGDIRLLARIAGPEVGIVTNVSAVHMERSGSIGRITAGKAELVEALPATGLAVLNGDDPRTVGMARRTRARSVLFGLSDQCDVRATGIESRGLDGFSFTLACPGGEEKVNCPLPGKHHVYAALAAAAVALDDGMPLAEITAALGELSMDMRLTRRAGPRGSTIIDDSYNASPASMIAALDLLSECPGRKIAVLGHMRELGGAERAGHELVGRHCPGRCDLLVVVGDGAAPLADAAVAAGHAAVQRFDTPAAAAPFLRSELDSEDTCLIKASRAVGLEILVQELAPA